MEDVLNIVSSQEESTYYDDTPTLLATENERYQIGEHMLIKSLKKLTIVRIRFLTCLRRLSQQQTITNTREDIGTGREKETSLTQTPHVF